ncbi:MAG: beta-ketoacyl-[acyl-carrier-protein] synthase II [Chitinophagaceae bacterium]|nr:MAG: beta-ketoacyl-[acyl-carrier-protein] synthase II [Chitinophagaceae bacterium]
MKRVVVTGLGVISPLGNSTPETWKKLVSGQSGAGPITRFDHSLFKTHFAAEVKGFDPLLYVDKKDLKKYDPFTLYALAATQEAVTDAGIDFASMPEAERRHTGVIWASGNGGISTFEAQLKEFNDGDGTPRFNPFFIPKMIVDIAAGVISIKYKLHGPNYCTVSACASSNTAIISAFDTIRLGRADRMIAGGSEAAITEASVGGFNASQALSKNNENPAGASRPFDANRDGFVMGEGAGALVLEELGHALARGARIYAELKGGGMAADAYHLTGTAPDGIGAALGMQQALDDAGLRASDITYVNAHATSTAIGDLSELQGIRQVFGDNEVLVTAPKSMTGHLLGAAGAIESVISVLSVYHDLIPGTINLSDPDPGIPASIKIMQETLATPVSYVLNNTFGFGGHTASSLYGKYKY